MKSKSVAEVPFLQELNDPIITQIFLPDIVDLIAPGVNQDDLGEWLPRVVEGANAVFWVPSNVDIRPTVRNLGANWSGEVSSEAFGLICSLYLLNKAMWAAANAKHSTLARRLSDLYSNLKFAVMDDDGPHPEFSAIYWAID